MSVYKSFLVACLLLPITQVFSQTNTLNYTKTVVPLEPVDANTLQNNYDVIKKLETVSYFDGLGKPIQTLGVKQTSNKKDLIKHYEYDQFGRIQKSYLSLPSLQNTSDFLQSAKTDIENYYQTNFSDSRPYSEVRHDDSPLNRKLEESGPGDVWDILGNSDLDHTTKYGYELNEAFEVYDIQINENGLSTLNNYYDQNELVKNTVRNINWKPSDGNLNTKEIFTDKNGRKIAEFAYVLRSGNVEKIKTYYAYDNRGNLIYVLPPKLFPDSSQSITYQDFQVSWPTSDFTEPSGMQGTTYFFIDNNVLHFYGSNDVSQSLPIFSLKDITIKPLNTTPILPDMYLGEVEGHFFNGSTFLDYPIGEAKIESGSLVIERYTPLQIHGAFFNLISVDLGSYSTITLSKLDNLAFQYKYDQFNRQIAQKVPGKDWEYMVYDQLDRPILTQDAILKSQNKWMFNKYDVGGRVVYTGLFNSTKTREELQSDVDAFINSSSNKANIEERSTTVNSVGNVNVNYSNNAFPNSNIETLTVNYYDDYNFSDSSLPTIPSHIFGQEVTQQTKGLLTSTWTRLIDDVLSGDSGFTNIWSKTYSFYDNKGQNIYLHEQNNYGGYTTNKSKIDFAGKTEFSETSHKLNNDPFSLSGVVNITDRFEYDHLERLTKHYQTVNSKEEELISSLTYNELGQVVNKKVGGGSNFSNENNFKDIVGLQVDGNYISKTSTSSGWNAGLATKGEIVGNGSLQFQAVFNQKLMVGLSYNNTDENSDSIDFAIYLTQTNHTSTTKKVHISESGNDLGFKTDYVEGDQFSIERVGSTILYKKNGETFYTHLGISNSTKLIGDISIHTYRNALRNLKISSNYTQINGLILENLSNNTVQIKKASGTNSWNAGLASVGEIKNSSNGYLKFKPSQSNKRLIIGLSEQNTNDNWNTIDYAIYLNSDGSIRVLAGSFTGILGYYSAHDEFEILRDNNIIYYKKNGEPFHFTLVNSTPNLIGDISISLVGGALYDLEVKNLEEGLQSIDYTYDLNGRMLKMNDVDDLGSDLFAYEMVFEGTTQGSAQVDDIYNGNIKQTIWKSAQNNTKKSYAYEYDKLGRFSRSHYREGSSLSSNSGRFETFDLFYDTNGNIDKLKRTSISSVPIDNLNYFYDEGNKLLRVSDGNAPGQQDNGFIDNGGGTFDDYNYDSNGNLIQDFNKGISTIIYNHLDLVEEVYFFNGNKIEFDYDANGTKLQMRNIPSVGRTLVVDYVGGFQYTKKKLSHFPTPEGYVARNGSNYQHVYIYGDHLGNKRVSYTDTNGDGFVFPSEILSNTDYYAMGLTHQGEYINGIASNYNYRFQGKERLDFSNYNMYDFGSRMYDPSVGRWFNTDPQNQFSSPYLAMGNNWVIGVDPNGQAWHILGGAVLGGAINLIANWDNIDNFGEGLAAFGTGALVGGATAACGTCGAAVAISVGGGVLMGATNDVIAQTNNEIGINDVNWGSTFRSSIAGGISGFAGHIGSKYANKYVGDVLINKFSIKGLAPQGLINGVAGGAGGGFTGGFASGLVMSGGNFEEALDYGINGAWSGSVTGGTFGFGSGYLTSKLYNLDPWTGKIIQTGNVKITQKGLNKIKSYLSGQDIDSPLDSDISNDVMIRRLENIIEGRATAEQVDLDFYTHELREMYLKRYRNYNHDDSHLKALKDYKIKNLDHNNLYTPDANKLSEWFLREQVRRELNRR